MADDQGLGVDFSSGLYSPVSGGDPTALLAYLKQKGIGIGQGLADMAMTPGNALQSTPDNPVTTEQLIQPATNLAMTMVGTPGGVGGLGAGARIPKTPAAALTGDPYIYHISEAAHLPEIQATGLNKGTYFGTEAPAHVGNVDLQQQFPAFRVRQSGDVIADTNRGPLHPDFLSTNQIGPQNLEILRGNDWVPFAPNPASARPATVAETAANPAFFDYSRLHETPDVPQIDLPRYEPPRGVPARVQDLTADPAVREKMLGLINQGVESGAGNWYNTDPLRQSFVEELGKRQGAPAFQQYMDMVAATSPRSKVPENVRNASYYYTLARRGEPMPEVGTANPAPYGHLAQKLHQANAGAVAGEGWNPLQNPKPASFAQNLSGNFSPVTVDTHAFGLPAMLSEDPRFLARAMVLEKGAPPINPTEMFKTGELTMPQALERPVFWASKPNANEYGAMENYYKGLAREANIAPAQAQAAAWSAGGDITGLQSQANKPFIGFVEDRLRKTAAERGISMAEALSQMIRGKAPLLSVGGAGAVAAPLLRDQQQPQPY
jgi:hypothetical protein